MASPLYGPLPELQHPKALLQEEPSWTLLWLSNFGFYHFKVCPKLAPAWSLAHETTYFFSELYLLPLPFHHNYIAIEFSALHSSLTPVLSLFLLTLIHTLVLLTVLTALACAWFCLLNSILILPLTSPTPCLKTLLSEFYWSHCIYLLLHTKGVYNRAHLHT